MPPSAITRAASGASRWRRSRVRVSACSCAWRRAWACGMARAPAVGPASTVPQSPDARVTAGLEDVERRLVLAVLVLHGVGVGFHLVQVLGLDPFDDAGAACGQQPSAGTDGDLDHAFGRIV